MECDHGIFLPGDLITFLQEQNICTLNTIADGQTTSIWRQGWKSTQALNLENIWVDIWNGFTHALSQTHIKLSQQDDELSWVYKSSSGSFSAKLDYQALVDDPDIVVNRWTSKLWKIKAPPKGTLLFWLILKGEILTWDHLQHFGW